MRLNMQQKAVFVKEENIESSSIDKHLQIKMSIDKDKQITKK